MTNSTPLQYTAFDGHKLLASGALEDVALRVKRRTKTHPTAAILIFSDASGKEMDLDLRGSESEAMERLKIFVAQENGAVPSPGPGRPKLGVVAREVSLLPRHWEWLATQSGGASAAIRRLIEDARKHPSAAEKAREAQERTHKFMTSIAGDFPNYEEALRALYAKDKKSFQSLVREWPKDVQEHTKKLAAPNWESK